MYLSTISSSRITYFWFVFGRAKLFEGRPTYFSSKQLHENAASCLVCVLFGDQNRNRHLRELKATNPERRAELSSSEELERWPIPWKRLAHLLVCKGQRNRHLWTNVSRTHEMERSRNASARLGVVGGSTAPLTRTFMAINCNFISLQYS